MENGKLKYIVILLIAFLLLGIGIILISISSNHHNDSGSKENEYHFSPDAKKPDDMKDYTNEELKREHCLNSICIRNVEFHYTDEGGRIDYYIENRSNKILSGYLKLVFGEQFLIASYHELDPNTIVKTSSYFADMKMDYKEEYVLKALTKEEESKLVVKDK